MKISDLSLLEAFVRVATFKSFSVAAEKLNLSLPNVSKKVQQLEASLGVKLLHRTTRSVSLTSDGEKLLPRAEEILYDIEALQTSFTQHKELSGEIQIACLPSVALRWLPEVLISFQTLHPQVRFRVEASDRIVDLVAERIDVAIRVQNPKNSDLVFRKLSPNKLTLVASPKYLEKYGHPKELKSLKEHRLLMLDAYAKCRFVNEQILLSRFASQQFIKTDNGTLLTEMALAHGGIAVRSQWDIAKHISDKKLLQVLPKSPLESFGDLHLVTATKASLNRRTIAFVEHAIQYSALLKR